MSEAPYYAWHWLNDDGRISTYRGVRNTLAPYSGEKVEAGKIYRVEGKITPCRNGLHASKRALDGLGYAEGCIVSRVILSGTIVEESDKAAASERTVLWVADATKTLHEFAVWCAEQALLREREAGREPDPRSWNALEVKLRWLTGQATDEDLAAARDAARAAAWDAARDAARAAAWDAAMAAARAAARDAARAAAWDAAMAAARAAAWDAAWDAQNAELERRLMLLVPAETPTVVAP